MQLMCRERGVLAKEVEIAYSSRNGPIDREIGRMIAPSRFLTRAASVPRGSRMPKWCVHVRMPASSAVIEQDVAFVDNKYSRGHVRRFDGSLLGRADEVIE
jgi:hypothetical protein